MNDSFDAAGHEVIGEQDRALERGHRRGEVGIEESRRCRLDTGRQVDSFLTGSLECSIVDDRRQLNGPREILSERDPRRFGRRGLQKVAKEQRLAGKVCKHFTVPPPFDSARPIKVQRWRRIHKQAPLPKERVSSTSCDAAFASSRRDQAISPRMCGSFTPTGFPEGPGVVRLQRSLELIGVDAASIDVVFEHAGDAGHIGYVGP